MLLHGDCLEVLKTLNDSSVDSLVTDPPAGISFMGKDWDDDKGGRKEWCAWMESVMRECLRVLKPGAHGLVWSIPRTSHWTATALEDAGFEVRDCITHLFGSGFPKSLDISKAIDKAAGETPKTEAAKQWQGWGTALKPAAEFWWLVRKPLSEKTVAANVQKWGCGGINIDGCRVGQREEPQFTGKKRVSSFGGENQDYKNPKFYDGRIQLPPGRFPANLVFSHSPYCTDEMCDIECAVKQLDEQSLAGGMHSAGKARIGGAKQTNGGALFGVGNHAGNGTRLGDSGGASRFFYCAKISKSERNAGCEHFGETRSNHHPTVKPKKLMGYLCKLITPPGGTVLDPFMGSGSTGIAAKENGFEFIGIERDREYFDIARARIAHDPNAD